MYNDPLEFSVKILFDPEKSSGSYHLPVVRSARSDLSLNRKNKNIWFVGVTE